MSDVGRAGRGSAVKGFAWAALALAAASLGGAETLNWLSRSGRIVIVADHPAQSRPVTSSAGVDLMPTGSVPARGSALMIRLR